MHKIKEIGLCITKVAIKTFAELKQVVWKPQNHERQSFCKNGDTEAFR